MSLINRRLILFGEYTIDRSQWRVTWQDELVPLNRKTFDLLLYLVDSADRVVTKEELLRELWPNSFVEESNLTQHIFLLRKALSRHASGEKVIETVPGRGYRLAIAVEREQAAASEVVFSATESVTRITIEAEETIEADDVPELPEPAIPPLTAGNNQAAFVLPPLPGNWPPRTRFEIVRGFLSRHVIAVLVGIAISLSGAAVWSHARSTVRVHGFVRLTNDGFPKDPGMTTSIVTDGAQIFFTEVKSSQSLISRVSVSGGETMSTPAPIYDAQVADVLPAKKELLIGSTWRIGEDPPMLTQNIETGTSQTLWSIRAHDGSWSPDGKRLAFAQGSSLFVGSLTGDGSRKLATVPGILYWPRWSPDGQILRFSENFNGYQMRLWEVNADGSNLHPFIPDRLDTNPVCCGSWTPSGRSFVYLSLASTNSDICVLPEPSGLWSAWRGPVSRIKSEPLDRWSSAVPGRDGKHIFALGEQFHGRLMRINPESHRPEPYLGGISAEGVAFSPDGSSIAFTSFPEGTLWRSRKDGTGRIQLTTTPLIARFPRWSPDGKTIVFVAGQAGTDWRLYTVAATGGAIVRLTQSGVNEGVANWSPDGKTLSFGHLVEYTRNVKPKLNIEMLNLIDGKSTILPNSEGLWTARWSPDGNFLSALTEDNHTLRLYDLKTGIWSDAAKIGINDVAWSPDSKYLFFDTIYGEQPVLYRLRIADRKLEVWAQLRDSHRTGFFGSWLGMAPDGSPIFLDDASIQEVYSIAADLP